MSWEAWFTLGVAALAILLLARDLFSPAAVMFGAVTALLVVGVIDPGSALGGFANPAPITVAALYVVAAGVERTGLIDRFIERLVGPPRDGRGPLARLLFPSAVASGFLNNTPIVAMTAPAVERWAERTNRPASRLLMPLSFAAILGGMATIVGTSTNIVVSGLLEQSDLEPLGFFEVATLGLPIAVVGLLYLVVASPRLLPDRRSARDDIADSREYAVELEVVPGGTIDGKTIAAAGLRRLSGVFLVQVEREGELQGAVGPDLVLHGADILRFVGNARNAADLHEHPGLRPTASPAEVIPRGTMGFFEAVVGAGSPLVGRSLRDVGFRERYRAAVLAIHRADQRVLGKLGDAQLRVGDTLLVLADTSFRSGWHGSADFLMVARLDAADPTRSEKSVSATVIAAGVIALAASGLLPILEASLLGAFAMVVVGVLTTDEARRAVDLTVVVLIASALGIGTAMYETGLADRLAESVVGLFDGLSTTALLVGISLVTIALTEAVTNNAAAVLVLPIGLAAAAEAGSDPRAFAIAIAVAASASFLTPIGYQTNTMVWGIGGYRFFDFFRLGLPLTVLTLSVVAVAAPLWWSL